VFVPCAFISGITGQFFRQFALTIASSTIISTFNSLTLSPALAAFLLQERDKDTHEAFPRLAFPLLGGWIGYALVTPWLAAWLEKLLAVFPAGLSHDAPSTAWWSAAAISVTGLGFLGWRLAGPINRLMRWFFRGFNAVVKAATGAYTGGVGALLHASPAVLGVYAVLLGATYFSFTQAPKGFIPTQDMGYLMAAVQLPDAAAVERTRAVTNHMQEICRNTPGVKHTVAQSGSSFVIQANACNLGSMFVILDDFSKRRKPELSAEAIAKKLRERCAKEIPDAVFTILPAPPVRGVGRTGGFKFMVEDRGDLGLQALQEQSDNLAEEGRRLRNARNPDLPRLVIQPNVFRANAPQLYVNLNRAQCLTLGVPKAAADDTLQVYLGSWYVNDFNLFGRTWQVNVQADGQFRNRIEDVKQLRVRNNTGSMVPMGTLADVRLIGGPLIITRYNMYPASAINGYAAQGVSSRQAIDLMQQLADRVLPSTMRCEWTELAYLELQAGNTAMWLFALAVVAVFLVLAAQYESWSLPLAVILVVPMCLLSAIAGVLITRLDINIFTQIGFVVLVGLASKNAILIVEFAKRQREAGASRRAAALEACQLRLRPIVMTSFAFILGVVPLLVARGAGAEMRFTLGTAVFSGMLGVTLFGIFLTPVFFNVIDRLGETQMFNSRLVKWVRFLSLGFFALGFVWMFFRLLGDLAWRQWRESRTSAEADDSDQPH
jgi:multidrug efflux pump